MDDLTSREPRESGESVESSESFESRSKKAAAGGSESTESIDTVTDAEDLVGEDAKLGKAAARVSTRSAGDTTHTNRSIVSTDIAIPDAPFYGSKVVEIKDLTKIFDFINETALFKGQWQYKQGRKSTQRVSKDSARNGLSKFAEVKAKPSAITYSRQNWFYGYFPCQSSGNDLIIYEADKTTERLRFTFPRQPVEQRGSKNLCLADYFASVDSGRTDVVAFDLVTMGRKASEHSAQLFAADRLHRLSFIPRALCRIG